MAGAFGHMRVCVCVDMYALHSPNHYTYGYRYYSFHFRIFYGEWERKKIEREREWKRKKKSLFLFFPTSLGPIWIVKIHVV